MSYWTERVDELKAENKRLETEIDRLTIDLDVTKAQLKAEQIAVDLMKEERLAEA